MDRIEKVINILKLTPHYQPELVKEACHRILAGPIRENPQNKARCRDCLKPLLEILLQYCDNEDSAQRSLFNDLLNTIISSFKYDQYHLILDVLLEQVNNNGSVRLVAASLKRIPSLIENVRPIELGCESKKLLKALIEVSRRSEDETVLSALDQALIQIIPFLDHDITKSRDMQMLCNSLIELLIRNLYAESSNIKRLSASSLASISSSCQFMSNIIETKLFRQLQGSDESTNLQFLPGFSTCVKYIPNLVNHNKPELLKTLLTSLPDDCDKSTSICAGLDLLVDILEEAPDLDLISDVAKIIVDRYLLDRVDNTFVIKSNSKVILVVNALKVFSAIVRHIPEVFGQNESILLFKNHEDLAVRNQLVSIMGDYIEASWRFPLCIDEKLNCDRIRSIWFQMRAYLIDETTHVDTLKHCINSFKGCIPTLMESDHCLQIVEYEDFNQLINLYHQTNFKPLKVEMLRLFSTLNYRTIQYLEDNHWSNSRSTIAGSFVETIQEKVFRHIIIKSLTDDHQKIRKAASKAVIDIIPNLYLSERKLKPDQFQARSPDPIVDLAQDLANNNLGTSRFADERSPSSPNILEKEQERKPMPQKVKNLTSSIVKEGEYYHDQSQSCEYSKRDRNQVKICINLKHVVSWLKDFLYESFPLGKLAISSIVETIYKLGRIYPIIEYPSSWDCTPTEYCLCFTLLNFLLTYMENLTEPDIIVEDLDCYRNFLSLTNQLLYALCHESILSSYISQRQKPLHVRQAETRDGDWSELSVKPPRLSLILNSYFEHIANLLRLLAAIIKEQTNPFAKQSTALLQQQQSTSIDDQVQPTFLPDDHIASHRSLANSNQLYTKAYRKLESSHRASKKSLRQKSERFYQVLDTCLVNLCCTLEFIDMTRASTKATDMLSHLEATFESCRSKSLRCARQLLKSLFGINMIALYQVDPEDWFREALEWVGDQKSNSYKNQHSQNLNSAYHHLITNPYKLISKHHKEICFDNLPYKGMPQDPSHGKIISSMVIRRIEDRVRTLFETNFLELTAKVRSLSDFLKNIITEFTPMVRLCINQFDKMGFCALQMEVLHFMSYLILLRVNFNKLDNSQSLIHSIDRLIYDCQDNKFSSRKNNIHELLRASFAFITLLNKNGGPNKSIEVTGILQRLNNITIQVPETDSDRDNTSMAYHEVLLKAMRDDTKEEELIAGFENGLTADDLISQLFHRVQIQAGQLVLELYKPRSDCDSKARQLASYILHMTYTFQSGQFVRLSRIAADRLKREICHFDRQSQSLPNDFRQLCQWSSNPDNSFCLEACEKIFFQLRHQYPDLTIGWSNVMNLLNNVDCNRDYWCNMLNYSCSKCNATTNKSDIAKDFTSTTIADDQKLVSFDDSDTELNISSSSSRRPSSLKMSDLDLNSPLRRSFMRKIAKVESRERVTSTNIKSNYGTHESKDDHSSLDQCLAPNFELLRRGILCLVSDHFTINMNDAGHVTWLIINHINDIIRWSQEPPIAEFITAAHSHSASSGIFIQAIGQNFRNFSSISLVRKLVWTVHEVHYTQYGSLLLFLVEKLLTADELLPYRSLTRDIETFACEIVGKLLNKTNTGLVVTDDDVINQLVDDDLDRIFSTLDHQLYPHLSGTLEELRDTSKHVPEELAVNQIKPNDDSEDDSEEDDHDRLYKKAELIYCLATKIHTARISILIPALNSIRDDLRNPASLQRINNDKPLACLIIACIYKLARTEISWPLRHKKPRFWLNEAQNESVKSNPSDLDTSANPANKKKTPTLDLNDIQTKRPDEDDFEFILDKNVKYSEERTIGIVRDACLMGLFLVEHIDLLRKTHYEALPEIITLVGRLPLINSFVLTPSSLWKHGLWPPADEFRSDKFRTSLPIVTHDILLKEPSSIIEFTKTINLLGWLNRRQFEEIWMTLLGVLSANLSITNNQSSNDRERQSSLYELIPSVTRFLLLSNVSKHKNTVQSFDQRVISMAKSISSNLPALKKVIQSMSDLKDEGITFSKFLQTPAEKARFNATVMQDYIVIEGNDKEQPDINSCLKLLTSVYNQKIRQPQENEQPSPLKLPPKRNNTIPPPLASAIAESILALSELFSDMDQFDWMFETFIELFKVAEYNQDFIQLQYLILGLCKSVAVCCYQLPLEVTTLELINHRDVMFEKCRQSIDKCLRSDYAPLKLSALYGAFYVVEDSVHIVASGAYDLDNFTKLRQSRFDWIRKLSPIFQDESHVKTLTKSSNTIKLLRMLCQSNIYST